MVKAVTAIIFATLTGFWTHAASATGAEDLWVVLKGSKAVAVLGRDSLKEHTRVPVSAFPHEVLVRGKLAVVSLYGRWGDPGSALALIDITSRKVVGEIPLGEGTMPHGIIPTGDPNLVVVTAEGKNKIMLVDIAGRKVLKAVTTNQGNAHLGTYDAKRQRVYVSNISTGTITALSLKPFEIIKHIKTGDEPEGIAYHKATDTIWVSHRKDNNLKILAAEDFAVKHTLATGKFPVRISFNPSGSMAIVSLFLEPKIQVFGTSPVRKIRDVSLFAGSSWATRAWKSWRSDPRTIGQVFSPNDNSFYIAVSGMDRIVQFNGETFGHLKTINLGKTPDSMVITPSSRPTSGR